MTESKILEGVLSTYQKGDDASVSLIIRQHLLSNLQKTSNKKDTLTNAKLNIMKETIALCESYPDAKDVIVKTCELVLEALTTASKQL